MSKNNTKLISGARVRIYKKPEMELVKELYTDSYGRAITYLPPNEYQLYIEKENYYPHQQQFELPPDLYKTVTLRKTIPKVLSVLGKLACYDKHIVTFIGRNFISLLGKLAVYDTHTVSFRPFTGIRIIGKLATYDKHIHGLIAAYTEAEVNYESSTVLSQVSSLEGSMGYEYSSVLSQVTSLEGSMDYEYSSVLSQSSSSEGEIGYESSTEIV